jgi:hypothetical protein
MRSLLTYADYLRLKQDFVLMPSVLSTTAILNLSYFSVWLVGFTTAEGCFSIRLSGYHSFSISQTYDQSVITAVQLFFQLPNLVRFILAKSGKPFYLIETYNRASLLRVIDFFDNAPIQLGGEKLVQYNNFRKMVPVGGSRGTAQGACPGTLKPKIISVVANLGYMLKTP